MVNDDVGNEGQQKASLGEKNAATVTDLVSDDDVLPKVKETSSPSPKKKKKEKKKKSEGKKSKKSSRASKSS